MLTSDTPSIEEAVNFARLLAESDDQQRVEIVHRLRYSLQLSRTVRGLNLLLEQPQHRPVGRLALRSLGLEQGG